MKQLLLVFMGGGLGSMARYLIALALNRGTVIPWHTFMANVIGCFLVGITGCLLAKSPDHWAKLLVVIGFCGGFTTFSTFSFEIFSLAKDSNNIVAILYIWISMLSCMAATSAGFLLTNFVLKSFKL